MTDLVELLTRPEAVPFLAIGDPRVSESVGAGATPKTDVPEYWAAGAIPWMSSGEVNKGTVYETDRKITQAAYDSCSTRLIRSGAVVVALAGQGKTRGTVARTRLELCTNQSLAAITPGPGIDADFLYYYLQTRYRQLREASSGEGTRGGLNLQVLRGFLVPVPAPDVQREIAAALDSMNGLITSLDAELALRRQQSRHCAHILTAEEEGTPRARLGEVAKVVRGASPRPVQAFLCPPSEGVPWIKIGDVAASSKHITSTAQYVTPAGASKSRRVQPGDFVLSNSMSFGRPYISKIDGYIHDGWLAISDFEHSFVPEYLYYLLRSAPIQAEFERRAGSGTVKNLNAEIVKAIEVPIPSKERQLDVVQRLNVFDELVNDPAHGLPAEIELRRKQFEYYRQKLVTFVPVADGASAA